MKRALCVGINAYPSVHADLRGCLNDLAWWKSTWTGRGYDVAALADAEASRSMIVACLDGLVSSLQPGDAGVFTFSGHGTRILSQDSGQPDGFNDALCPSDVTDVSQLILDCHLFAILSKLRPGVKFTFISDCCHSGTNYRELSFPAAVEILGSRFLDPDFLTGQLLPRQPARCSVRLAPPPVEVPGQVCEVSDFSGVDFLHVAACRDTETAADAHFPDSPPMGALSWSLKKILQEEPSATVVRTVERLSKFLPSHAFPQSPLVHINTKDRAQHLFLE